MCSDCVKMAALSGLSETLSPQERPGENRVVVAIVTTGRSRILASTVRELTFQDRLPDLLLIVTASPDDIDPVTVQGLPFEVICSQTSKGTTRQRNAGLKQLHPDDIVLFMDDDFLLAKDYLHQMERLFRSHPDIVMATGKVLADGIGGPGIRHEEGKVILDGLPAIDEASGAGFETVYNGYGCNMAMRARPIIEHDIRFDELLPLYGWLEDVDFSRQLAPYGRIVRSSAMRGVHLGTKMGRGTGVKLGYSQVCNPIYLHSKGTMMPSRAYRLMARNIISNIVRSIRPEAWVDRRGRLRGNVLATLDLLNGRMRPDRVEDLN